MGRVSHICSLDGNDIGPAGAKAFADALPDNTTLLSLKSVFGGGIVS